MNAHELDIWVLGIALLITFFAWVFTYLRLDRCRRCLKWSEEDLEDAKKTLKILKDASKAQYDQMQEFLRDNNK